MALTLGRKMGLLGGGRLVCRSPPESLAFTWRPHCVRAGSWVHPRAAPQGDNWSTARDAPPQPRSRKHPLPCPLPTEQVC